MPDHVRQQIRQAAAALLAGLASTGSRVYPSRVRPLGARDGKSLFVYTTEESSDTDAMGSMGQAPRQRRAVELVVEGRIVSTAADPEDDLDTIAVEVETRLGTDPLLGNLLCELTPTGTKIDMRGEGEAVAASIAMTFRAVYRTAEFAPTVSL